MLLVAGLCAALLGSCATGRALWGPGPLPAQAEHVFARTADGWDISLIHYRPNSPVPNRRPLILLHGIVTNERSLDLDARHSFARSMAEHGFDTWAVSLRGTGESTHASLFGTPYRYDWDFDTYCTQDVPAAIAEVQRRTGSVQVDVVGHSLGGMLLYCVLARGGEAAHAIGAGATIGSLAGFRFGPRFTSLASTVTSALSHLPGFIALKGEAIFFLPALSAYPEPGALFLYNPANMDPVLWSRFIAVGVEDESTALLRQAALWIKEDRLLSRDGKIDYVQGLAAVRTPILVVAGKLDQLGFPPLVKRGYDALAGEKKWLLIGEENGASADYGHLDLLLGDKAAEDVFAPVAAWLAAHEANQDPGAGVTSDH